MERVSFLVLLLVTVTLGAPLISVLQQIDNLSVLNSHIANSTNLTNLLTTADNFTLLAPSNDAFNKWLGQGGAVVTEAEIEETLLYHLLHGGFPTIGITSRPQFASSNLPNGIAANVTGGQVVEVVADTNGIPQILSANKTISTITAPDILCTGGIVHIIDSVLRIPKSIPRLAQEAQLRVTVALLEKGGFLATSNAAHIQTLLTTPDTITFLPNSIAAMDTFNNFSSRNPTQAQLNSVFDYHFVAGVKGYSSNLFNGQKLRTVQGKDLTVTKRGNDTFINGAKITTLDLVAENGVAHVIDGMLDPSNITGPPPPVSSGGVTGISDAVLGVGITFAVLVPVALGILLFWYCKQRRKRISEGQKEYLRTLENQEKARRFGEAQQADLQSPISTRTAPLPFSNSFSPSSSVKMPFSNNLSPSSNQHLPFSNAVSPSSNTQLPFSNKPPPPPDSELADPNSYISPSKKASIYEMDATSVHGTGKNKALPKPR